MWLSSSKFTSQIKDGMSKDPCCMNTGTNLKSKSKKWKISTKLSSKETNNTQIK